MALDDQEPSLFANLPEGEEHNIPLLLERIYGRITRLGSQVKMKLGEHEKKAKELETRIGKMENCPCAVYRDPAHKCPVLEIASTLGEIKLNLEKEMGAIRVRLALWAGGLGVIIFLLEAGFRLWPYFRG